MPELAWTDKFCCNVTYRYRINLWVLVFIFFWLKLMLLYVHRNRRLSYQLGTVAQEGRPPRLSHTSWALFYFFNNQNADKLFAVVVVVVLFLFVLCCLVEEGGVRVAFFLAFFFFFFFPARKWCWWWVMMMMKSLNALHAAQRRPVCEIGLILKRQCGPLQNMCVCVSVCTRARVYQCTLLNILYFSIYSATAATDILVVLFESMFSCKMSWVFYHDVYIYDEPEGKFLYTGPIKLYCNVQCQS